MSKHLIGINAEVYILYEDKVLFKSSGKKKQKVDLRHCFCSVFPFMNNISVKSRNVISSIKVLILFLVQEKKNRFCFLDLNPSFETVISRFSLWLFFGIFYT